MNKPCKPPLCSIKDSRGDHSRTLFFVAVSWVILLAKFLIGGLAIPILGIVPEIGALEFGTAAGALIGVWVAREWKDKELEVPPNV